MESEHLILVIFWGIKNNQISLSICIIIIRNWYSTNLFNLEGMPLTDFQETGKKRATKFGGFRNGDDVKGQSTRHRRVMEQNVAPTCHLRSKDGAQSLTRVSPFSKPLSWTSWPPHHNPLSGPYPYPQIINTLTSRSYHSNRKVKKVSCGKDRCISVFDWASRDIFIWLTLICRG